MVLVSGYDPVSIAYKAIALPLSYTRIFLCETFSTKSAGTPFLAVSESNQEPPSGFLRKRFSVYFLTLLFPNKLEGSNLVFR